MRKLSVRPRRAKAATPKKKFRVFVHQVNQTFIDVEAVDEEEARTKGYAIWRRDYAHSTVASVESAE